MKVEWKNMEASFRGKFIFLNEKWLVEIALYNESINKYHSIEVPYEEISFINDKGDVLKKKLLEKAIDRREKLIIVKELVGKLSDN